MTASTRSGSPDRLDGARREVGDVGRPLDRGLHDGELVAAEPGDDIGLANADAQPRGHGLQQRVADRMAERSR